MRDKIQECASRVVSLLREKRTINVLLFPQLLGERSHVVYQALGWLAHEGRVHYSMKGQQCYVSLSEKAASEEGAEGGTWNAVTE